MECIITGCAFIQGNRWVAGDLHQTSCGVYVFVGNPSPTLHPDWIEGKPPYTKHIRADRYFDRRAVFVIEARDIILNEAALLYIGKREL
jgi:hypothetical protein